MRLLSVAPTLILFLACTTHTGIFEGDDGSLIELHVGADDQVRGYLREGDRIAALSSVRKSGRTIEAAAVYDDGSNAGVVKKASLIAVEKPASDTVRTEIEEAYRQLARAVDTKNFEAFQAIRLAEFATIPPDGIPSPGSRMADRAKGLLERIQPPITTTNDILELTTRGDEAIATVRQKFTRQQMIENQPRTVHTEVTQRETWRRTPDGWKLAFVDEVRDHITLVDGQPVQRP